MVAYIACALDLTLLYCCLTQHVPIPFVLDLALQQRWLGVVLEAFIGGGQLHRVNVRHVLYARWGVNATQDAVWYVDEQKEEEGRD